MKLLKVAVLSISILGLSSCSHYGHHKGHSEHKDCGKSCELKDKKSCCKDKKKASACKGKDKGSCELKHKKKA